MSSMYKWVGRQEGRGWAVGGKLYPLLQLFEQAMSPRSANHNPKHALMA